MRGIAVRDIINYTTLNPGDGGILDKLQNVCGSHFQFLNSRERMALIRSLSIQLCMEYSDLEYNAELNEFIRLANGLSISDRIGLIRCLADNTSLPTIGKKNGN